MKTTVVYHSADFDGIFCREIARKFIPDAELIGWNFGDPILPFPDKDTRYYVLDLPLDKPWGLRFEDGWLARDNPIQSKEERQIQPLDRIDWDKQWVWIDHHKTSIATHPASIPGYRIDGVAACRLAWQWFTSKQEFAGTWELPGKQSYIERLVIEPLAVRLAGEYDIWDKRDPLAETLQYGLRTRELTPADWDDMLCVKVHSIVSSLLDAGEIAQRYAQHTDASVCKSRTWLMEWEGLRFLCLNSARFNSLVFAARDLPETGHDALLGFCYDGRQWNVSLYHAKHRTDLDLSLIAKKHGGGGHRGACGFTAAALPFSL